MPACLGYLQVLAQAWNVINVSISVWPPILACEFLQQYMLLGSLFIRADTTCSCIQAAGSDALTGNILAVQAALSQSSITVLLLVITLG